MISDPMYGVHAISILINNDLQPHCDSLNPSGVHQHRDYTIVSTVIIQVKDLDPKCQDFLKPQFEKEVPICIVIYNQNCLLKYCSYMKDIDYFIYC